MVNPGDAYPPGEDWVPRQLKSLQDQINALASARSLESSSIGSGGLTIQNGGSITVEPGGNITLDSGTFTAATVNGTTVHGTTVNGTTVNAGNLNASGLIRNVAAYSNPITTSYRAVWVTSVDGQFGYNLSSREFKQDIADFAPDPATVLQLRLVTFRYIAAVEAGADETQVGLIAEEVHDLGLDWLVEYDEGKPCGIKFHLIAMALLTVAQTQDDRITALEQASKR